MRILAIESSCDETAAAVVEDGRRLLSNAVHSQIDIHAEYGGVIPEVAARSHIEMILPIVKKALHDAQCTWDDINAIAVTYAPGLGGSLLIGTLAARTLALLKKKPLYPIHHVEAHVYANFITQQSSTTLSLPSKQPDFPMLALIVSGGHSQLVLFRGHGDYDLLGQTQDDAIGEAFDKVAKIIGLPYPGGPAISNIAPHGNPYAYTFPKAKVEGEYNFSFSGVKTAVLRAAQKAIGKDHRFPSHQIAEHFTDQMRADFAASFQRVAVETLIDKTKKAFDTFHPRSVVIAGGVAANTELRKQLQTHIPVDISYAPMCLCTDNAVMIGALAYYQSQVVAPCDPYTLDIIPHISMNKTAWNMAESK